MLDNIRFVHHSESSRRSNGFTIAYLRSANHINFAVATVNKADHYDKSIGRVVSAKRLEEFLSLKDYSGAPDYFDNNTGIGCVTSSYVFSCTPSLNNILADQTIMELSLMDLKHSFLSAVLREIVVSYKFATFEG